VVHFAARAGNLPAVEELVRVLRREREEGAGERRVDRSGEARSPLDALDRWYRTPLHWAVVNNHARMARVLLEAGATTRPHALRPGRAAPRSHLVQETALELAERRRADPDILEALRGR